MDLNSLHAAALEVAERTKFPKDLVKLVCDGEGVGVEFANSGLFVIWETTLGDVVSVRAEHGSAVWLQPLDRMLGQYNNLKLAMIAAGMIIQGADLYQPVTDVLCNNQHDATIPPSGSTAE
jgi:hypothetical protein